MNLNPHKNKIIDLLAQYYPNAKIALNFGNNWQLFVAVVLSAQCTDVKVNQVTEKLFKKYASKTLKDEIENYANVNLQEFEQDIRQTGFFHQKAFRIINSAKIILEKFNGEVPKTMTNLLTLPGVARKTANVILSSGYGIAEGIAVDTHVIRLSQRLRLVNIDKIGGKKMRKFTKKGNPACRQGREVIDFIEDADPVKIESELMKNIDKSQWLKISYRLIDHGRSICKAVNPNCERCPLNKLCPATRV